MRIEVADVMRATRRLQGCMKVGESAPAKLVEEVAAALLRHVRDVEHLDRAVTECIEAYAWFPSVAEVVKTVRETALAVDSEDGTGSRDYVPMGCADCGWTGYRIVQRGPYEGAAPCACLREGRMAPRPVEPVGDMLRGDAEVQREALRVVRAVVKGLRVA